MGDLRGGEVCVEGRHTVVHVGADGRPAPLPDEVRERLAAIAPER
jgi:acyl-CoA thioester hydrolase